MEKIVTYDDTRDIAIRVIYELIELGYLKDDDDHYFEIQDTIQDEINEVLGLEMDETEEVIIKNITLNKDDSSSNEEQKRLLTNYTKLNKK